MAEPIVGMKYGTYNTLRKQNEKYSEIIFQNTIKDGAKTMTFEYWGDINASVYKKPAIGKKVTVNYEIGECDRAFLEVIYGINGKNYETLLHSGDKCNADNDIVFDRILGDKSYAVDDNKNGIVDEGEIKSYDTIA